ncbi:MAG: L,D-transpeptidase [Polyangiaceae bacterium]
MASILGGLFMLAGCTGHPASPPSLSKTESDSATSEAGKEEPAVASDGPTLVVLRDRAPVMEQPSFGARILGELRLGAQVVRSANAVSHDGCVGGWYAVQPRGFLCAGALATLDVGAASWLPKPPDLTRPLPYRYGRTRVEGVPKYAKLPSAEEQAAAEPDLSRYLSRHDPEKEVYGPSANDVPLDARGVASGPPLLTPGSDGVDASNKRSGASYFSFPADRLAAVFPAFERESDGDKTEGAARLRKGSGVAITTTGTASAGGRDRRFGLTPDGMIVPIDRLKPALGSIWHGIDLDKVGLPVAFVHKNGVHGWKVKKGDADKTDEELERRTPIPLTGRFRTIDGIRFDETEEGFWLRAQDITVVVRRSKFPEFAKGSQKWLDVSLANQTITAYEGRKPVYATLISSGRDVIGDPQQSAATPRGTFRVVSKHVSGEIDGREVHQSFEAGEAPWILRLDGDFAITGNYWTSVGEAHGFHNIALAPIDARRIWMWADPQLPEGWHGAYDATGVGTIVYVRP